MARRHFNFNREPVGFIVLFLASGQTPAQFSRIQAARGRKGGRISGAKRYQGSNEEAQPWEAEGISRRGWYKRQATTPRRSIEELKPWVAEGISRRTWYYQKKQLH